MFSLMLTDKKLFKLYAILSVLGVVMLSAIVVNAWYTASSACEKRWEILGLRAQYTRHGCVVEVSPHKWVRENNIQK